MPPFFALILAAQKANNAVLVVDMRRTFALDVARDAGIDTERLLVSMPDDDAQAAEIALGVVKSGVISLAVLLVDVDAADMAAALPDVRGAAQRTNTVLAFA